MSSLKTIIIKINFKLYNYINIFDYIIYHFNMPNLQLCNLFGVCLLIYIYIIFKQKNNNTDLTKIFLSTPKL